MESIDTTKNNIEAMKVKRKVSLSSPRLENEAPPDLPDIPEPRSCINISKVTENAKTDCNVKYIMFILVSLPMILQNHLTNQ